MTPFGRWLRKRLEKFLGRWEEGQQPPARLRDEVTSFANFNPKATRAEWLEFAASFAEACYLTGYIRGVEWAERDPEISPRAPEQLADEIDPEWRNRPFDMSGLIGPPEDDVPESRTPFDVMFDQTRHLKPGRFR